MEGFEYYCQACGNYLIDLKGVSIIKNYFCIIAPFVANILPILMIQVNMSECLKFQCHNCDNVFIMFTEIKAHLENIIKNYFCMIAPFVANISPILMI